MRELIEKFQQQAGNLAQVREGLITLADRAKEHGGKPISPQELTVLAEQVDAAVQEAAGLRDALGKVDLTPRLSPAGPTPREYVRAGYSPESYPPQPDVFAPRLNDGSVTDDVEAARAEARAERALMDEEKAAAVAAEAAAAAPPATDPAVPPAEAAQVPPDAQQPAGDPVDPGV